jgi:hypothetical protein
MDPMTVVPLSISRLKPYANNARTHSPKQIRQIADSIAAFGFTNPVLIGENDEIIAGHGRVEAAKLLGMECVPTLRLSRLNRAQRRAYVLADNKLALEAGWDRDVLARELTWLSQSGLKVEITGFAMEDIAMIVEEAQGKGVRTGGENGVAPGGEKASATVTRSGDTWLHGPHRVVSSDPGDFASLDRLMGDGPLAFIAFDPAHGDLVARHFRELTGHDATLAETGQSFTEGAEVRSRRVSKDGRRRGRPSEIHPQHRNEITP